MALTSIRRWLEVPRRSERGNVTLDHLLWALWIVVAVGVVTAVLTAFINGKIALLH